MGSGKHVRPPDGRRRAVPLAVASVAATVLLVAGIGTACQHTPAGPPPSISQPALGSSPTGSSEQATPGTTATPSGSPAGTGGAQPGSGPTVHHTGPAPSPGGGKPAGGTCRAGYYAPEQVTASGEPFDPNGYTAANRTMPFNTRLKVTNLANGNSVVVRVNDRGPSASSRCLDLTPAAFTALAPLDAGVITVRYQVVS